MSQVYNSINSLPFQRTTGSSQTTMFNVRSGAQEDFTSDSDSSIISDSTASNNSLTTTESDASDTDLPPLIDSFRSNRFTISPMRRHRRRRAQCRVHPTQVGMCYLYQIHPMYWNLAYTNLKKNPYQVQVRAFIEQLLNQHPIDEQIELMSVNRLHLRVRGFQCHITTVPINSENALNVFDLMHIIPDNNFVGLDHPTQTKHVGPPDFTISWSMLAVFLLTIYLRLHQLKKRFFWRNNVALTLLIPLVYRLIVTGHMFTTIDLEENKLEPIWLFCKIGFLLVVIPRPSGFRWLIPSVIFWNHILQLFALANGYMYFCSMLDAQLPFNRLPPQQILATTEQREEWTKLVNNWRSLIQLVTDTYAT